MAYADDIASFHSGEQDAQRTIDLCGEFFALNHQAVNPKKSLIKKINVNREIAVRIYGNTLPTVEGQSCSRYLGVWLQSDGGIQSSRRKLDELLARFRNLLQTKTCSVVPEDAPYFRQHVLATARFGQVREKGEEFNFKGC
jgi:hypothetical protein